MSVTRAAVAALAWLGRQGTRAIAAVVLIGIAVPPIGAVLRPFVTPAIFILLCIAFLRVDAAALRSYLRRPQLVLAATAWTMLAVPLLFGLICLGLGLETRAPDLFLALMLQAVAPPMMAAPAFAALMGHTAADFIDAPLATLGLAVLAFAVSIAVLGLTAAVFARAGKERAFVLGLMASQRNMGLMLAATGGALPDYVWLYFALCQFPIYLFPQLLKPLARRLAGGTSAVGTVR